LQFLSMITPLGTFPLFINGRRKLAESIFYISCAAEFVFRLKINELKKL
jgi:hypothetical protein